MSALELKIPPVLLTLLFAAAMWLLSGFTPGELLPAAAGKTALLLCLAMATVIGLAGVAAFRKANTSVNPLKPDSCSSLVAGGIFRYSRNPMYLALFLALAGWGLYLANIYSLLLCAAFIPYMNRFQIQPEERALEKAFGQQFLDYRQRTRRWI